MTLKPNHRFFSGSVTLLKFLADPGRRISRSPDGSGTRNSWFR